MRDFRSSRLRFLALAAGAGLALSGCHPEPAFAPPPQPSPTAKPQILPSDLAPDAPIVTDEAAPKVEPTPPPVVAEADKPTFVLPPPPVMPAPARQLLLSSGGRSLVLEYETGGKSGYDPHPEAPDPRLSGVTWGIGYDGHYNSPTVIKMDWAILGSRNVDRLAAMHPYYGRSAQAHLKEVRDITVAWQTATDVFDNVDVAREFANAKRAVPGFEKLRPNAQAAWISLGFNRGWAMSGPNRVEMREMRDLTPKRDYEGIAFQLRKMVHIWRGTSIERGMTRRRIAEAKLMETP
jgi:GH24 family phage-related lysozyme (muramidase)